MVSFQQYNFINEKFVDFSYLAVNAFKFVSLTKFTISNIYFNTISITKGINANYFIYLVKNSFSVMSNMSFSQFQSYYGKIFLLRKIVINKLFQN